MIFIVSCIRLLIASDAILLNLFYETKSSGDSTLPTVIAIIFVSGVLLFTAVSLIYNDLVVRPNVQKKRRKI